MINHIVILKFKPNLPDTTIDLVFSELGNLMKKIPTIKRYSYGINNSPEHLNQGYTHAFVMEFDDVEGRDFYIHHSEHQRVARDIITPTLENGLASVVVVDYVFTSPKNL